MGLSQDKAIPRKEASAGVTPGSTTSPASPSESERYISPPATPSPPAFLGESMKRTREKKAPKPRAPKPPLQPLLPKPPHMTQTTAFEMREQQAALAGHKLG